MKLKKKVNNDDDLEKDLDEIKDSGGEETKRMSLMWCPHCLPFKTIVVLKLLQTPPKPSMFIRGNIAAETLGCHGNQIKVGVPWEHVMGTRRGNFSD